MINEELNSFLELASNDEKLEWLTDFDKKEILEDRASYLDMARVGLLEGKELEDFYLQVLWHPDSTFHQRIIDSGFSVKNAIDWSKQSSNPESAEKSYCGWCGGRFDSYCKGECFSEKSTWHGADNWKENRIDHAKKRVEQIPGEISEFVRNKMEELINFEAYLGIDNINKGRGEEDSVEENRVFIKEKLKSLTVSDLILLGNECWWNSKKFHYVYPSGNAPCKTILQTIKDFLDR